MKSNEKYYKLEELEVGMRVSVASLDKIYDTIICLDIKTLEYDTSGIAHGTIIHIGNDDYMEKGIDISDVMVINNTFEDAGLVRND